MPTENQRLNDYDKFVNIMFKSGLIDSLSPTEQEFRQAFKCIIKALEKKIEKITQEV